MRDDKVRRLLKAAYKPVLPPPEFKERLLKCLLGRTRKVPVSGDTHKENNK